MVANNQQMADDHQGPGPLTYPSEEELSPSRGFQQSRMCVYQEPTSFCPKDHLSHIQQRDEQQGSGYTICLPPDTTDSPDACLQCFPTRTAKAHAKSPREKARERGRKQEESEKTEGNVNKRCGDRVQADSAAMIQ